MLVPESAHGTNPATAALLGYSVVAVPGARRTARCAPRTCARLLAENEGEIAAIMLTNPNTCGIFEPEVVEIAEAVHEAGGYFYCDGANFNAIMGKARPGDLGVDAMHINLHKTFSTPHGGGGPGAGPVVLSEALAPFAPVPFVVRDGDDFRLVEHAADAGDAKPLGRMCAFHGQMGMFVRAYRLDALARLRRHAAGVRGRGAQRQLRPRPAEGHHDASPSPTIRPCTRRCSTTAS